MNMNAPAKTYEGEGFSGRCAGEVTLPGQSRAQETEIDTPQPAESEGLHDGGLVPTIAAFIVAVLLLLFLLIYIQGTFDHFLYKSGLNWETCGQGLSGGEILCGNEPGAATNAAGDSFENGVKSWLP